MTATLSRQRPSSSTSVTAARVGRSLARREAGFTLRHPLIAVGALASLYLLWSFNRGAVPHVGGYSTYVGLGLAPLSGAALLVAHLQTSRAQRNDTFEIEDPAPAQQRIRTLGHLIGSLAVAPLAALLVTAYVIYLYWIGGAGGPDIGELLVGPLVVSVAALAGVAAGSWFPNRFSGLVALAALAGVQIAFQDAPGTLHWFSWWHTVLWYGGFDLWIRPTWAHIGYLVGVAAVVGAVATLRNGLRAGPIAAGVIGIAFVLVGGAVQAQPPNNTEVDRRFEQLSNPASFWVVEQRDNVAYRFHPSYELWVERWQSLIAESIAPIPPADRPALVVEQRHHAIPSQLLDEFGVGDPTWLAIMERANELYFGPRHPDPWPIRVGDTLHFQEGPALVIAAAMRAVGLPLVPIEIEGPLFTPEEIALFNRQPSDPTVTIHWPGRERGLPPPVRGDRWTYEVSCDAEGQAREVIAAWLAAQASPPLADLYREIRLVGPGHSSAAGEGFAQYWPNGAESPMTVVQWDRLGWIQPGAYGGGNGADAVIGSPTATDLAAQLLDRPQSEVTAAVNRNWTAWTDRATSIQVLIDTFALEQPPTPEQWIQRAGRNPADFESSIAAYPRLVTDELTGHLSDLTCQ